MLLRASEFNLSLFLPCFQSSFSVVTGVRIVEHNRAIYLQIQVGYLLPAAIVAQSSVHWQDLPYTDNSFATYHWDSPFELILGDEMKFHSNEVVVTGLKLTNND
jgi:hypothetical protein